MLLFWLGTGFCLQCQDSEICLVGENSRTNHNRNGRQVRKAHAPHPSREVGGVENGGKRQLPARCHVQVWRFDVENDDDVRDAVVADDGGGGERADVDDGDESSGTRKDVEPQQRLRVESPKRGATGREEGVL